MDAALEQRLIELEMRLSFQEQALAELSEALAASRKEAARAAELLERALSELRQPRGDQYPDPASEPPPPHY
jgi:SlyX protein